jgi:S-DNA-T family DNA segregation ATPase FtsK/SpoIIIE
MAKSRRKISSGGKERKLLGILLVLLAALLFASLATHSDGDDQKILTQSNPFRTEFHNQVGTAGAYSSYLLFFFLGWLSYFVPVLLTIAGIRYFPGQWQSKVNPALWFGFSTAVMATTIVNVYLIKESGGAIDYTSTHGGFLFYYLTIYLIKIAGATGSVLLMGAGIIVGLVILGYSYASLKAHIKLPAFLNPIGLIKAIWSAVAYLSGWLFRQFRIRKKKKKRTKEPGIEEATEESEDEETLAIEEISGKGTGGRASVETEKQGRTKVTLKKVPARIGLQTDDYKFPGLDLLADNDEGGITVNPEELAATARALKDTLETFGVTIDGQIDKYPGPVITRFEFKPAVGVKVHQIINLSDDLALALKAKRIRIIAPIPGKAAVGVEIPNLRAQMVFIKEIINSDIYADGRIRLPLAMGKTISGRPFVADLARMPHLLIAGATGSGKSVCINSLITSLLYRLHPRELKFIFIDPKMLELSVYSGIPHLGRPVVTNPKRAEKVLADAVSEMENRYKKLAGQSVRNIEDFNARQKDTNERMPYIIIIVDELADMMMAASSSRIEMLITRLAQMARAVGIHLILATQRPSVDVITGLIKANFSARVAFQVASKIDSRTILDGNGAEKLLGNGDMLFLQPGQPEPVRVHGAFISGGETERLVKFIVDQFPAVKKPEGEKEEPEQESEDGGVDLDDPLFIEAADTVIRHKQGSVSLLQRKLGIGYQRAARLIDKLEDAGIVSAYDGSKAREVLVDRSYLEKLTSPRSLSDPNS